MKTIKLVAHQFDFQRNWNGRIWPVMKTPNMKVALQRVVDRYLEIAECKFEETLEFDAEYAQEVLELDRHTASVMVRDLDWIRRTFESADLAPLSLSIAESLYPDESWSIEGTHENSVVTNPTRSLVFDILHYDQLSAQASLSLAGVAENKNAQDEFHAFLEKKIAVDLSRIEKMTSDLNRFQDKENVISLP